jgi:hypothetical protein
MLIWKTTGFWNPSNESNPKSESRGPPDVWTYAGMLNAQKFWVETTETTDSFVEVSGYTRYTPIIPH